MMMQPYVNAHNYIKKGKKLKIGNLHAAPELLGGVPLLPEPDIFENRMRFSWKYGYFGTVNGCFVLRKNFQKLIKTFQNW
jgi:hypothetical protein